MYQFLSGVRVTPDTRFLSPNTDAEDAHVVRELYHYMHFAIGVYGWPMYFRYLPFLILTNQLAI